MALLKSGYSADCISTGSVCCTQYYDSIFTVGGGPNGDINEIDLFLSIWGTYYGPCNLAYLQGPFHCGFRGVPIFNMTSTFIVATCEAAVNGNFNLIEGIIGSLCTLLETPTARKILEQYE